VKRLAFVSKFCTAWFREGRSRLSADLRIADFVGEGVTTCGKGAEVGEDDRCGDRDEARDEESDDDGDPVREEVGDADTDADADNCGEHFFKKNSR
jgi:hypothetical protein